MDGHHAGRRVLLDHLSDVEEVPLLARAEGEGLDELLDARVELWAQARQQQVVHMDDDDRQEWEVRAVAGVVFQERSTARRDSAKYEHAWVALQLDETRFPHVFAQRVKPREGRFSQAIGRLVELVRATLVAVDPLQVVLAVLREEEVDRLRPRGGPAVQESRLGVEAT